jgi:hypothetical protein
MSVAAMTPEVVLGADGYGDLLARLRSRSVADES